MHRYIVYLLAILMFPICLWLATIWPAWYWGVGLTAAMVALGTWDLLQKRSTLRRNYPVMAHFRYGLESIGPEIRQYFVQSDLEDVPFSRQQRALIYQRAKNEMDTVPFGCFTRATWQLVGGLNESLLGNEDYEFNYRVRRAGLAVRLDPMMHSTYVARASLGALALQYFRYGWCKMQMLRQHPASLRWRQTLPVAFVAGLLLLAVTALFVRPAATLLALVLLAYIGTLATAAFLICAREGGWHRFGAIVTAFATIQLCWGAGALTFLATSGHWPDRRFLFGQRAAL